MKKLLVFLFSILISFNSYGGVGDVYYCDTYVVHKITQSTTQKFTNFNFKFKRNTESLIFGSGKNYFQNYELTRKEYSNDEYFVFNDNLGLSSFYHKNNNFNFSMVSEKDIFSTSGTCETF